jgi:antitoxin MazE
MILTKVKKWGNSLAIRLPKEAVTLLDIKDGSDMSIEITRKTGEITLRAQNRKVPTLEEMLKKINPQNTHKETEWGQPAGKEIW